MGKFTNFLRKIRRALDYICLNNLRVDGMEHLIAGILVVSMAQWFFSVWTAIALTLFILVGKEIVYDKWLRQGVPEWRDVFWGAVGMVLGLIKKKITPQSFYISKVIIYFVVSKLNSGTSRIHRLFFVPIYNVYLITKDILHRVGM